MALLLLVAGNLWWHRVPALPAAIALGLFAAAALRAAGRAGCRAPAVVLRLGPGAWRLGDARGAWRIVTCRSGWVLADRWAGLSVEAADGSVQTLYLSRADCLAGGWRRLRAALATR